MIAAMILILSAVTLAVLYYTPYCRKHLNITNDVNSVEVVVTIGVLFFLALCFIFLGIYIKRTNRKLPYRRLQSDIGVTTVPRTVHLGRRVSRLAHRKTCERTKQKQILS